MGTPERFEAVMADGARIVCRIFGGGERALLLLHGNGEDHTCFQKQVAAFSGRFRVIAMDSRGHGESSAGSGVTIAKIAEDAAAVLGAITAPTLVLAGDRDLIRPAHTALIAASLPHAKLVTIPRSDHWIFDRQPVRVNREILAFLG